MVVLVSDGKNRGVFVHRVNTGGNTRPGSACFASVMEYISGARGNMGLAVCRVLDVVPGQGFVDVRLDITWEKPLPYRVTLLIARE